VRKTRPAKRRTGTVRKGKLTVDATRLALAALERIKSSLRRKGHEDQLGPPATMRELAARSSFVGVSLPPSYVATLRAASLIGGPERLLDAVEMRAASTEMVALYNASDRLAPFAKLGEHAYACFDRAPPTGSQGGVGELTVTEWVAGIVHGGARHFGEWLDTVADSREEALEQAAEIPPNLRDLLVALGFTFTDPIVGRVETGDAEAIETLLGTPRAAEIRGTVGRLFDSSGRAAITLNVDEFTMAVSLRTGLFVFEPEDVFRWLRWFRDEGFFGEATRPPSHPDRVRDLRKAPREPPLVLRGVLEVSVLPARKHQFRAAAGRSADDFYVLGRTGSTSDRSPSLLLHVMQGQVRGAQSLDEPLIHLHVQADGTVWGLSQSGSALRFSDGAARAYPLDRGSRSTARWYGIGGNAGRVMVWGAGAILVLEDDAFVPFIPAPELEEHETVVAAIPQGKQLGMLVCGDGMGAVARFDGRRWVPIPEEHVIEGQLVDLDVWRGVGIVLSKSGEVWRVDDGPPRPVIWDTHQAAFVSDSGAPRATYAVRGFDGGALLASDGGIIAVGSGDPVFHAATGTVEPARLARIGGAAPTRSAPDLRPAIVALCGPNAWIWRYGPDATDERDAFWVIDVRDW
jgi:hypothetical protein